MLVGGPVAGPLPAPLPLSAADRLRRLLGAGLPSELLLVRPDILGAEERLRAAEANIGAARAAFFPNISLTGALGLRVVRAELTRRPRRADVELRTVGSRRRSSTAGVCAGNSDVAQAQDRIALADYERTIQVAFQEVTDALAGRRYLAEQVAAQERTTLAERAIAQLARARYREGVVELPRGARRGAQPVHRRSSSCSGCAG